MSRNNIAERRAYIKSLIDAGIAIDIRGIAKQWNSSPPAIVVDISMVNGLGDPYRAHPTKKQNQRAARMGAEGELTTSGWNNILKDCNYACVICGSTKDIVIDHIIPLSKGGTNTLDNVQPLCRSCNSSKGNRLSAASRENGRKGGRPRKS